MRNFKLALARLVGVLALALGYYLYQVHSKKNIDFFPPCLPGYFIGHDTNNDTEYCIKNTP